MSKQETLQEKIPEQDSIAVISKQVFHLQDKVAHSSVATIFCQTKKNNPNYFSIIFANKKFYEIFGINEFNLIGKSYDFLFTDLELDYSSEDQIEYVRLIKSVKDSHPCSVIITISDHQEEPNKVRFKITFAPSDLIESSDYHHATFTFERMEAEVELVGEAREEKKSTVMLLKNLERTLRSERLLREIGVLIISDLPIREIAEKIAKILCEYLKADRCLIHDYQNSRTNFVIEYHNNYTKKMFEDSHDEEALQLLARYINFQNHFFEKYGSKEKKSSLTIIEDVASDINFTAVRSICEKFSIASQIAVTTIFNDKVNGGIYIHQSDKRSWTADEIELVEMVADQFSIAVDRSESIERVMITNHALMERTSQLKEALKHEQEMRQMQNEFVALVSHEFKTPLQIIDSTRELLTRKIKNHNIVDESIDKSLERIRSGIKRMNGLIHSTLNLAKMESGDGKIKLEIETFDLKEFIFDIIEKNSNLAQNKNIKVMVKIDDLPTEFMGDPKLLDHSITNIISNAIKYSKNDTTVKIMGRANDSKVALRIIDQGMGIPKEDLANIGQKFFRAKNTLAVAGTGIGIYLTKHFIELHGGNVLIESEIDVGTSVTVTLPRTT